MNAKGEEIKRSAEEFGSMYLQALTRALETTKGAKDLWWGTDRWINPHWTKVNET